ncbi:MAG: LPS assembly protein LptD [Holosporales bacterium]|nr:LPS assembly protein LptD [Holosporales bacterium]
MKRIFICVVVVFIVFSSKTFAEIILDAKIISIDKASDTVSASGEVVVIQELNNNIRELHCEKIEYNGKTKELKLIGDSMIKEPTGEIVWAKSAIIDTKLKNAIIRALKVVLTDNSKIRAEIGTKVGEIYTFENASYTPCKESSCVLPLWDLAAERVVYDVKKKAFIYHNVKLRMKGHTIAFLPYFKHPAFGIKRQTGFLSPIINSNNDAGLFVGIPYYIVLDEHKDLKLTPFFNTHNRAFMSAKYRQSLVKGDFTVDGSFLTKAKKRNNTPIEEQKTRWHINTLFKSYNIDNRRITLKIDRVSDVTYKMKYPVSDDYYGGIIKRKGTESKFAVDFFDNNYFVTTDSYIFQTPDKDTAPILIPHFNANYRTTDTGSGIAEVNSDVLCLARETSNLPEAAKRMFRTSNNIKWAKEVPVNNVLIDISSGLRLDAYSFDRDNELTQYKAYPILENQISGFLPLSSAMSDKSYRSIWGPKAAVSSIESLSKRKQLNVNEDSVFSSFDDLNIYQINRFGMYDKIENGEKIAAGIENSIYNSERRVINFFIGKSHEIGNRNKGDGKNSTVGRFIIKPSEVLSLRSRFVGVPFVEKIKLLESGMNVEIGKISTGVGYLYDSRINSYRKTSLSQFGLFFGVKMTQYWNLSLSQIINMKKGHGHRNLSRGIFIDYKDECFGLCFGVYTSKYKDKDVSPQTGFMIAILFKNLANIGGGNVKNHIYASTLGKVA